MRLEQCSFMVDLAHAFFSSETIDGCCHAPNDVLVSVGIKDAGVSAGVYSVVGLASPGVPDPGSSLGFGLQALAPGARPSLDTAVPVLTMGSGKRISATVR